MKRIFILTVMSVLSGSLYAADDVANTTTLNTISRSSIVASPASTNASDWNLTNAEWAEYQTLMHGAAGYYYSSFSPPEVLGLYAKNEIEIRHYAEVMAKQEHEKVERELRLDRAFHEAALRLYQYEPVIKPFDITPYTPIKNSVNSGSL